MARSRGLRQLSSLPNKTRILIRSMSHDATTADEQKVFLSSPRFAVVGDFTNPSRPWATKVLQWYKSQDKSVTPVDATLDEVEGISTVRTLADLPVPSETSISIIAPAKITLQLLEQAKALSIPSIWLQPGAAGEHREVREGEENYTEKIKAYIQENRMTFKVILGGPCVMVQGSEILQAKGQL